MQKHTQYVCNNIVADCARFCSRSSLFRPGHRQHRMVKVKRQLDASEPGPADGELRRRIKAKIQKKEETKKEIKEEPTTGFESEGAGEDPESEVELPDVETLHEDDSEREDLAAGIAMPRSGSCRCAVCKRTAEDCWPELNTFCILL